MKPVFEIVPVDNNSQGKTAIHNSLVGKCWQHDLLVSFANLYSHMGKHVGETSTGHPILLNHTPEEAFPMACRMLDMILAESERRGYLKDSPTVEELKKETASPGFLQEIKRTA